MLNPIREGARRVFGERYLSIEAPAGRRIDFVKAIGDRANLLVIVAEEESSIKINNQESIPLRRDETIVMINVLDAEDRYVESGQVKVFATTIPRWLPAMFWTRSVTVLGVADAVFDALDLFSSGEEGSADYVTSDTLSDAVLIDARKYNKTTIMIKNTDPSNSADVAVYTRANLTGSIEYEVMPLTTLAPGDIVRVPLEEKYARIIVRAKSTVSGSPASLRIEWIGGKG